MGLLGAAYSLGVIVGAAVAWRIGGGHVVLAFALVAALAGLGFLSVLLFVSEPNGRERQETPASRHGVDQRRRIAACGWKTYVGSMIIRQPPIV
jgi:hypothetical protein